MTGRNILLGVSGSVAAFKAAALASELTKAGATVRVILTQSGEYFVGAETFRDLTGQSVATSLWDAEMDHIELAHWAHLLVVAPASAHLIARMALGLADDLLSTVLLSASCPILIAPAMETHMWEHSATRRNIATVKAHGVVVIGPAPGRLSSGESGLGRMAEPSDIVTAVENGLLNAGNESLAMRGFRVIVTAGPTREAIDPVRFISNHSSGKMGYAVAEAAQRRGADVYLISGPVAESVRNSANPVMECLDVSTAAEMQHAVLQLAGIADVIIMAAAVSDFRPVKPADQKLKKSAGFDSIMVEPTDDILTLLAQAAPQALRIGFAAETSDLIANAEQKLMNKELVMLVANDVSHGVFGSDFNRVTILRPGAPPMELDRMAKTEVADRIIDAIAELLGKRLNPTLEPLAE